MSRSKDRQSLVQKVGKEIGVTDVTSFEQGAKWADWHPDWKEGTPEPSTNKNGLPTLYLCQILTLDMTFGYRYSYRVGFVNNEGKWNVDVDGMTKVMRYMDINANESDSQMLQYDIPKFEKE